MRTICLMVFSLLAAPTVIGCVDRDPFSAVDVADGEAFQRAQAAAALRHEGAPTAGGKVRCWSDADGGLHIQAPQGVAVHVPDGASEDAEAEITLPEAEPEPEPQRGTMLRRTVSLGFIGDNKLTQVPSYGGPWNVPDGLLPIHEHGLPDGYLSGAAGFYDGYGDYYGGY